MVIKSARCGSMVNIIVNLLIFLLLFSPLRILFETLWAVLDEFLLYFSNHIIDIILVRAELKLMLVIVLCCKPYRVVLFLLLRGNILRRKPICASLTFLSIWVLRQLVESVHIVTVSAIEFSERCCVLLRVATVLVLRVNSVVNITVMLQSIVCQSINVRLIFALIRLSSVVLVVFEVSSSLWERFLILSWLFSLLIGFLFVFIAFFKRW